MATFDSMKNNLEPILIYSYPVLKQHSITFLMLKCKMMDAFLMINSQYYGKEAKAMKLSFKADDFENSEVLSNQVST